MSTIGFGLRFLCRRVRDLLRGVFGRLVDLGFWGLELSITLDLIIATFVVPESSEIVRGLYFDSQHIQFIELFGRAGCGLSGAILWLTEHYL